MNNSFLSKKKWKDRRNEVWKQIRLLFWYLKILLGDFFCWMFDKNPNEGDDRWKHKMCLTWETCSQTKVLIFCENVFATYTLLQDNDSHASSIQENRTELTRGRERVTIREKHFSLSCRERRLQKESCFQFCSVLLPLSSPRLFSASDSFSLFSPS